MTTRTVKFLGTSISPENHITVSFNGQEIFSGSVPVSVEEAGILGITQDNVLCTAEIPMDLKGNVPLSITSISGSFLIHDIVANYAQEFIFVGADIDGEFHNLVNFIDEFGETKIDISRVKLRGNAHFTSGANKFMSIHQGLEAWKHEDAKQDDVYINGVKQNVDRTVQKSVIPYRIVTSETLTCNVLVEAGQEENYTVQNDGVYPNIFNY